MARGSLIVCLAAIAACDPTTPTQALLRFEAEGAIATDAATLTIRVEGDGTLEERTVDLRDPDPAYRLPITFPIVPIDGDASRDYEVIAHLYDDAGELIGEQLAHGGYRADRVVQLRIVFSDLCREVRCPTTRTCVSGYCLDACHRVSSTPSVAGRCGDACALEPSSPIVASAGEVISNLRIETPPGETAILIDGVDGVTLRNLDIVHDGADAIVVRNASNVRIEETRIRHVADGETAPAIRCEGSPGLSVERVEMIGSATGILANECDGLRASRVVGLDFVADLDGEDTSVLESRNSDDVELEDFSVSSDVEGLLAVHRVLVFAGQGAIIRRGLAHGANRSNAAAVKMVDQDDVLIEDVDVRWSNHIGFEGFPATNVTLRRTRCRDPLLASRDGTPTTPFCWYYASGEMPGSVTVEASAYEWPGAPVSGGDGLGLVDATQVDDLEVRAPFRLDLCFDATD